MAVTRNTLVLPFTTVCSIALDAFPSRQHCIKEIFKIRDEAGKEHLVEGTAKFHHASVDGLQIRNMKGVDPRFPPKESISPEKNLDAFVRTQCTIAHVNQAAPISMERMLLMLNLNMASPLSQLVTSSRLRIKTAADQEVVLSIDESSDQELKGAVVSLDPAHDFLINRVQTTGGVTRSAIRFEQFEGVWLPTVVRTTHAGTTTELRVVRATLNQPIAEEELVVSFPEGARVNETPKGIIHLWGKGEPAQTFKQYEDFHAVVEQRTGKILSASRLNPQSSQFQTISPFWIWLNIIMICSLVLVFAVRHYWRRKTP